MTTSRLPQVVLDDRGFQELVSEARLRIAQACPEWTDHGVADPGITLIELFAQMVEQLLYRVNRIPEKLHVALMEHVGIRLDPASAARTDLRLRLSAPATQPMTFAAADTEVGTLRTANEPSVVFQVTEDFTIDPLRPTAYVLRRGESTTRVDVAGATARPHGVEQLAFGSPPAVGDALHLGFDEPIGRLVVRVDVEASPARGAGVDPADPPLHWEVSAGDDRWLAAEVLDDRTGGFNYGSGSVELQLPPLSAPERVGGTQRHWLRCRVDRATRSGRDGGSYTSAPEIYAITAAPIGALLPAAHRSRCAGEPLGVSDGTPGQVFELRSRPVLPLGAGETLEVRAPHEDAWVRWTRCDSFAASAPDSPHFAIDLVSGRIELGPAIREADGSWTRYGATPPAGSALRMTGYHHGGGRCGNVAAGTLTTLRSARAGVASVTNPTAATGGIDAESVAAARERAPMEIRSRHRAVTAEDYEFLACEASPRVARALCRTHEHGATVSLHLLPRVEPADAPIPAALLRPDEDLLGTVAEYLDERRTIGTALRLRPVRVRGVTVVADVEVAAGVDTRRVERDVAHALYVFLNPLIGGSTAGPGAGWPFGRTLNQGELYPVVHAIEGVETVTVLRVYETDLATGEQQQQPAGPRLSLEPDEVVASATHIVRAHRREV